VVIRELSNDEIRMAAELHQKCWNEDFEGILPKDAMDAKEQTKVLTDWMGYKGTDDIRKLFGAFEGTDFIGFIGTSIADKDDAQKGVEMNYLFLKKEFRGRNNSLRLIKRALDEYINKQFDHLIVYNWHGSESNNFYKYLGGEIFRQIMQELKDSTLKVDVFRFDLRVLYNVISEKLRNETKIKEGSHL
jgi:hypothetical protein